MRERKADRIRQLEYELGRYQKKIADEIKQKERLRELLNQANEGNRETQNLVNALLTVLALRYGEDAVDPDDPGKVLGKRLVLDCFDVLRIREKYEIRTRRDDEKLKYIIGVVERAAGEEN